MQKEIAELTGAYPIFGAAGQIGTADFYHQGQPYVAVVKDGAGIGRTMLLPAFSSVIGTLQYLIPNEKVLPDYLCYVVQHMKLAKYFSGATIPHIYFRDYKNEEFNLESLDRQREIVSILNRIQRIIAHRRTQLAKLDELVKCRFVELFGDPIHNTHHLPTAKLKELCHIGSSKRIYQNETTQSGIPFLKISDFVKLIDSGLKNCETFITLEKYNELCSKCLVPKSGDILISSRGTIGKCYIVKEKDIFYFQDGMISWLSNISDRVSSLFISYLFSMNGLQKQIDNLLAGSTVAYLSLTMLQKLDIIIPPIEEQHKFSSFVQQIDKLRIGVQAALDKAQTLFDSLMQEYFG